MEKILIVLPGHPSHIAGGYKVIFKYANKLVNDGYRIDIGYIDKQALSKYYIPNWVKNILLKEVLRFEPKWFNLDSKINQYTFRDRNALNKIGKPDIVISTAAITAAFVKDHFRESKKIYFIQGFEDWDLNSQEIYNTYNYGFKNIVVSKWLKKIVDEHSTQLSTYIRNPINTKQYKVFNPIENRDKYTIGMLYHSNPCKGSAETFESLCKLKVKFPQLKIIMFGTCAPPNNIPKWVKYYKNASQQQTIEIYNKISIFVCGSIEEGFGLTGLEAMACGATLVTTDYEGAKEYAINEINSLTVSVKDWKALREKVAYLIMNDSIREDLARRGIKTVKDFSWQKAYQKFIKVINNM